MNVFTETSDEDFVPFLSNLGVETYKKSYEWMLQDVNFAGVLKWLYNNLDQNNALTAREEYRYSELQKHGLILSENDIKLALDSLKETYPGIPVPEDHDTKEDIKLEIKMLNKQLNMLERNESNILDPALMNETLIEELIITLTHLNGEYQQCLDDEAKAAEECTALAQELEDITNSVVEVIAQNMDVYVDCRNDKEVSKRFFSYSPLETYRQTQALFRSHFDLEVSKNLTNRQNDFTDEDLRTALFEASNMDERLRDAALAFIKSKAKLTGQQAKLALLCDYNKVHSSQITTYKMEARSALELLEQEENIVEQQMQTAVEQMVNSRYNHAVSTAVGAALNVRQNISSTLTHLVNVWNEALTLDMLLYYCLRHELRTLEEFIQFAAHLRQYLLTENSSIYSRIESMKEITSEHESCSNNQQPNLLLRTLFAIFNSEISDESNLVKLYNDLQVNIKKLKNQVNEGFERKEEAVLAKKQSSLPLMEYIFDGCTKQPNCWNTTVASLTHSLNERLDSVDKRVLEATSLFNSVKNGDKQNLRKLWQWFLTDPAKLMTILKNQGCI